MKCMYKPLLWRTGELCEAYPPPESVMVEIHGFLMEWLKYLPNQMLAASWFRTLPYINESEMNENFILSLSDIRSQLFWTVYELIWKEKL